MTNHFFTQKRYRLDVLLTVFFALICSPVLYAHSSLRNVAQESWVLEGTVLDENGNIMPGVSIQVKGANRGIKTGEEGNFILEIRSEIEAVVISAVGCETQEIVAGSNRTLSVNMVVDE